MLTINARFVNFHQTISTPFTINFSPMAMAKQDRNNPEYLISNHIKSLRNEDIGQYGRGIALINSYGLSDDEVSTLKSNLSNNTYYWCSTYPGIVKIGAVSSTGDAKVTSQIGATERYIVSFDYSSYLNKDYNALNANFGDINSGLRLNIGSIEIAHVPIFFTGIETIP